jgi:non-specific serine/threonine protein kinase/serine/threonine-protein kinase
VSTADDVTKPPEAAGSDGIAGLRVGPYKLVRELGRGGMGTVYLAVRSDDQFQKRVAIKVLRRGMDTEAIVRRFRHERQILASLQHPYIAGLLDGGSTDDGLPYFAMEYVEGQVISAYCDTRNLNVSARLEIFRKVCAAVQYAHQNLIIHRDIKPANVLVTPDGTPKLLDFGIAKLLNPEIAGQTIAPTAAGMHLMTPEYASPEQVRGDVVTTATDVYSLGVLLYELLTGRRPYRITSRAPAELARVICNSLPVRPSTAVTQSPGPPTGSDESTGDGPAAPSLEVSLQRPLPLNPTPARTERLRRRLSGDLDTIVLKALSKEPDRRYASADQLSEDIRRHLTGLPVIARKDTVRYRALKFVQRNRVAAAAGMITFAALIAAVAVTTWQARVASAERRLADARFEDVRKLANSYLFELHDAIRDLPGSTPARKLLVSRGLEYLDKLAADASGDVGLRTEIAQAYIRFGDVQGRPLNPNLGDTSGALASYQKAIGMYEALQPARANDPEFTRELGSAYLRLSALVSTLGDTAQALTTARKALDVLKPLDNSSASADVRRELVIAHSSVGDLRSMTGDTRNALEERRIVLRSMEALAALDPSNVNNLRQLGVAYQKLGNSLGNPNYPNVGDHHGALENLEKCADVFRKAAALYPTNAMFRRNGAVADSNTADILIALDRPADAIVRRRQALVVFQELADADPANVAAQNDVAISTFKIAQMMETNGQLQDALPLYERAIAIHHKLAKADPENDDWRQQIASDASGLASIHTKLGHKSEALAYDAQALSISRALFAKNPDNVELQVAVALALVERGAAYVHFKAEGSAVRDYAEAVDILTGLEKKGVIQGTDLETLADARTALARLRKAEGTIPP